MYGGIAALMLAILSAGPAAAAEAPAACLAEKFPTNQLRCLSAAATAANDPRLCLAAEDMGVRWMCVARVAEAARAVAHCAALPKAFGRRPAWLAMPRIATPRAPGRKPWEAVSMGHY